MAINSVVDQFKFNSPTDTAREKEREREQTLVSFLSTFYLFRGKLSDFPCNYPSQNHQLKLMLFIVDNGRSLSFVHSSQSTSSVTAAATEPGQHRRKKNKFFNLTKLRHSFRIYSISIELFKFNPIQLNAFAQKRSCPGPIVAGPVGRYMKGDS